MAAIAPIGGPQAWRGSEIGGRAEWKHTFEFPDVDAVVAAARRLADDIRSGEQSLAAIGRRDAATEGLGAFASRLREDLVAGPGFTLVRGLPTLDLDDVENQVLYWMIGVHLGVPIHQDPAGSVLIRVRDQGLRWGDPNVRSYETAASIEYHSDSSDVVGLYCLRPALEGGTSTVVSSVAVHDEIVRRRPDLAPLLYGSWPHLSVIDQSVSYTPIVARHQNGRLFSRFGRTYIERAALRPDVEDLTSAQIELLDLYEELTNTAEFVLNMDFRPGDVQFLNNYVTMHSRTEYVDGEDRAFQRELLRLWLVLPDDIDVPKAFEHSGFVPRSVALRRESGK